MVKVIAANDKEFRFIDPHDSSPPVTLALQGRDRGSPGYLLSSGMRSPASKDAQMEEEKAMLY